MNWLKIFCYYILVIIVFTPTDPLIAQYVIEQTEQEIPINYELIPEDIDFDSFEEETNYIMGIDSKILRAAAIKNGLDVIDEKATTYIDGNNFAVETESDEMGKFTMVLNTKTGLMYSIMWEEKKVLEMNANDIKEIEDRTKSITEQMLNNLPEEYREQVLTEMKKEEPEPKNEFEIVSTGKKMELFGFRCDGYNAYQGEEVMFIWASDDKVGIVKEIKSISEKFDKIFKNDDEDDINEWDLIPGKIPVQVIKISSSGMYGEPVMNIVSITNIEKKQPPKDKFYIPGDKEGFSRSTMMDMMQAIPGYK